MGTIQKSPLTMSTPNHESVVWIESEETHARRPKSSSKNLSGVPQFPSNSRPTSLIGPAPMTLIAPSPSPWVDLRSLYSYDSDRRKSVLSDKRKSVVSNRYRRSFFSDLHVDSVRSFPRASVSNISAVTANEGHVLAKDEIGKDIETHIEKKIPEDNLSIKSDNSQEDGDFPGWAVIIIICTCISVVSFLVGVDRTIIATAMYLLY